MAGKMGLFRVTISLVPNFLISVPNLLTFFPSARLPFVTSYFRLNDWKKCDNNVSSVLYCASFFLLIRRAMFNGWEMTG